MLEYTATDVLFLPKIYYLFKLNCENGNYLNLMFENILEESKRSLEYCKINLGIKNFNKISIPKDKVIQGLLKY